MNILEVHRKRQAPLNSRSLFGRTKPPLYGKKTQNLVWKAKEQGGSFNGKGEWTAGDPYDGQFKENAGEHDTPKWKVEEVKVTELSSGQEKEFLPKIEDPGWNKRRDWEVLLLPVEVVDIKDHGNTGDDVTIQPWDKSTPIADSNIAWIDAHTSEQNPAPRMPQLEFRIPGLPQDVKLEAKLLVEYERPYAGKQTDDTVRIPANGSFQNVTNGRWEIWREYANLPFFGGDATLTFKINDGAEQTIKFAIGGRNPDDARCKAYIQGRPGAPWYAYAIVKHESQAYNPGHYNQFWERSGNSSPINSGVNYAFTKGDPLVVRSPGEIGVGGAGLAQVTGAAGNKTVSAPREIFWNWQKNVDAFLVILAGKIQIAEMFMNDPNPRSQTNPMPNGQRPQTIYHTGRNVPVPSRVQGPVTFGDNQGEKRPEDAVAIKAYNGAAAHWCSWQGPPVLAWQFNYGQNNYVEAVCNQIDP
ncbi:MAG: hypothetical protein RML49_08355 [Verrucomicrobiae bacterium]|nr:hypothetical protein [Verrucomicrobiae bacterium]